MPGSFIDVPAADGGSFKGYLAAPPAGKGPGIVLIQEIFGVNRHIRAVADGYAADGFVVLAPDVFWRIQPGFEAGYDEAGIAQGRGIMGKVDVARAVADLGATTNALRARGECAGKVAALGYCMGGRFAFLAAANTGADAAVCYYGGGIHTVLDQAARAICPILMHFGEKDDHIPLSAVEATRAAFEGRGDVEIHVYAAAGHGFNCDERGSYHAESARLARERSVAFLRKRIG
ncbi:MAG: dienelactone hydrolase family protein [Burkholderiales bacterium]|nr:dienelactone hydrolase family protein [Burkholderiales bacterium]